MSSTTVTAETPATVAPTIRLDVRGIPLERPSITQDRDPYLGVCPDWCDGRHTWELHDDRSHFGETSEIALELEDGTYNPVTAIHYATTIRSYLQQHYREAEPRVCLALGEAAGLYLTLAEAALLHDRLAELIDAARGGAR